MNRDRTITYSFKYQNEEDQLAFDEYVENNLNLTNGHTHYEAVEQKSGVNITCPYCRSTQCTVNFFHKAPTHMAGELVCLCHNEGCDRAFQFGLDVQGVKEFEEFLGDDS